MTSKRYTIGPKFVEHHLDERLFECVREAVEFLPPGYTLEFVSGFRKYDKRFHGKGLALDIQLIDEHGVRLPNYQDAIFFRAYEKFAQEVRRIQLNKYPHLHLRWGGYFSGHKGKYGALDLMHFDIGNVPMGGGSWETGLTAQQKKWWPGAFSKGMGEP